MVTCTCTTNEGTLYKLKASEFFKRFKTYDSTWKQIFDGAHSKQETWKLRLLTGNVVSRISAKDSEMQQEDDLVSKNIDAINDVNA